MKNFIALFSLILSLFVAGSLSHGQAKQSTPHKQVWDGKKTSFHGFDQYNFPLEGIACRVVVPKKIADGNGVRVKNHEKLPTSLMDGPYVKTFGFFSMSGTWVNTQ